MLVSAIAVLSMALTIACAWALSRLWRTGDASINLRGLLGVSLVWVPVVVLMILGPNEPRPKIALTWAALILSYFAWRIVCAKRA